jgi:DNA-binding beta-propeller fold protein YncE
MPGQYAEGDSSFAKFWEPLGVAYDAGRHLLYVADYRNRAIRMVDPNSGSTALLVGDPLQPPEMLDFDTGASNEALLTGPTTVAYDARRDALLFSDRRVSQDSTQDTGSIRMMHLQDGRVHTVVGKLTRQQGDGTVDAPEVSCECRYFIHDYPCNLPRGRRLV